MLREKELQQKQIEQEREKELYQNMMREKELQQKLDVSSKELKKMDNIQKYNIELEKKNENLSKMLTIVKNKNEIFISQIEELQNRNIDNNDKIQQLEAKLKLYKNDTIFEGTKGDKYKNLELQYKNVLEKNNKISNDLFSMKREIKELKEIKNKYNILIKEHESLLKTETLYNELLIKYNISQNNIKTLMNELNTMKKSFKKQQEEIESLKKSLLAFSTS